MKNLFAFVILIFLVLSCNNSDSEKNTNEDKEGCIDTTTLVEVIPNETLLILKPNFSRIDLVCGKMLQKSDSSVILFAEAAYTGELLKEFNHRNIAGDHVSNGKRENGFRCKRNTGAFVFYKGKWKFCCEPYSDDLDIAAKNGGAGFAQEMIILDGKQMKTTRKDSNKNQFRALCELKGNLCIIESKRHITFGDYRKALKTCGVKNAIYLDMGGGWNYAWYRPNRKEIIDLHKHTHNYCTNWITFYM